MVVCFQGQDIPLDRKGKALRGTKAKSSRLFHSERRSERQDCPVLNRNPNRACYDLMWLHAVAEHQTSKASRSPGLTSGTLAAAASAVTLRLCVQHNVCNLVLSSFSSGSKLKFALFHTQGRQLEFNRVSNAAAKRPPRDRKSAVT